MCYRDTLILRGLILRGLILRGSSTVTSGKRRPMWQKLNTIVKLWGPVVLQ
jgi:hypothetical protein